MMYRTNHTFAKLRPISTTRWSEKIGPPFSIPLAEVQRLYGGKLGYKVEPLSSVDVRKDYQVQFTTVK